MFGRVFSSDSSKEETEMAFSVQVDGSVVRDYRTIISIPSSIDGKRYVCFFPSGDEEGEQCKWFSYEAQRLHTFRVAHKWQTGKGDCFGCNERGPEAVWAALDPRSWLDGINSPKEFVAVIFEGILLIVMILAMILLCTKCLIPLARCSLHIPKISSKK